MKTKRISAGEYEITNRHHTYYVFRFRSDYGDDQWMIDKDDDQPGWAQADTLRDAKRYIELDDN